MKKFKLMMMAGMLAFASAASAQEPVKCFTAEDVVFEGNEADLIVAMDYETTETIVSWGFSLYLPDGISIAGEFEGDTFYADNATYDKNTNSRGIANKPVEITKKEDGGWLIVAYATGNPAMKSTHGTVVTLGLSGSPEVKGFGDIKSSSVANDKNVSLDQGNLADYQFAINGGNGTDGINDINVVGNDAPAYNLQGVRVNSNAKGLIIRDGKKVVVK